MGVVSNKKFGHVARKGCGNFPQEKFGNVICSEDIHVVLDGEYGSHVTIGDKKDDSSEVEQMVELPETVSFVIVKFDVCSLGVHDIFTIKSVSGSGDAVEENTLFSDVGIGSTRCSQILPQSQSGCYGVCNDGHELRPSDANLEELRSCDGCGVNIKLSMHCCAYCCLTCNKQYFCWNCQRMRSLEWVLNWGTKLFNQIG